MEARSVLLPLALGLALALGPVWRLGGEPPPVTAVSAPRACEGLAGRLSDTWTAAPAGDGGSGRGGGSGPRQAVQRVVARAGDRDVVRAAALSSFCGPLPPPAGNVVHVYPSQASQLDAVVGAAATGDTILLHDGTYDLHGDCLWFDTPGASYVGHYDGIVRNNFVFAGRDGLFSSEYGFDCGICLAQACGTQVVHNTVASTQPPFSSIEWRFSATNAHITNNLVTHNLRQREGASATLTGNLVDAPLSLFVDGAGGDLHLARSASSAIDRGVSVAAGLCDDDIDGHPRPSGGGTDIGADEVCGVEQVYLPVVLRISQIGE